MNPIDFAATPELTLVHRIIPAVVAAVIVAATVELIRRRKLREEYAMLWLGASAVLLLFALYPRLLWHISGWLGVYYLTTMVLGTFFFLLLLALRLGMSISRLTDSCRQIAQRLALLEKKLEHSGGDSADHVGEAAGEDESP